MISLVVIIIVTVVLIGIAVSAGFIYLERANELKRVTLSKTLGQVAMDRQNNLATGTADRYYEGYIFDISPTVTYSGEEIENKYLYINYLSTEDLDGNKIPDCLEKEGALWYLIDAESASRLNADGADQLLTQNIAYSDAFASQELVRVVLVDYATGEAFYVTMPAEIAQNSIKQSTGDCALSPDGRHRFTIATCTEDSRCIYCGYVGTKALGHKFTDATCDQPERCIRCGLERGEKLGHLYIQNSDESDEELIAKLTERNLIFVHNYYDDAAWITDASKHWHECIRCGVKDSEEVHTKGMPEQDKTAEGHREVCSICGWTSAIIAHTFDKPVEVKSEDKKNMQHTITCKACGYTETHSEVFPSEHLPNSAWYSDHESIHYRICADNNRPCNSTYTVTVNNTTTKHVAFREEHIDNNHDFYCDKCGRKVDESAPAAFDNEDYDTYARVKSATTYSIEFEAKTEDPELGVQYYEFGIYDSETNTVDWKTDERKTGEVGTITFYNVNGKHLVDNTAYDLYVRACDNNGNVNKPFKVEGKTASFPAFPGLNGMPETWVKTGYSGVTIKALEKNPIGVKVNYSQREGSLDAWKSVKIGEDTESYYNGCVDIDKDTLANEHIILTRETEVLKFKYVDIAGNESDVYTETTTRVDAKPPVIKITSKTSNSTSQLKHVAIVSIKDERSGILPGTKVRYAWNKSSSVPPSENEYTEILTENLSTAKEVSFEVETPQGAVGTYYLWIDSGIEDAVKNVMTSRACSGQPISSGDIQTSFIVDDTIAELSNITMLNENPAVPGEYLFVKTNGVVTIRFKASKELKYKPVVKINDIRIDDRYIESSDMINFECTLRVTDSYNQGTLQLSISEVMSKEGKLNSYVYTNININNSQGPVYYDKTYSIMEYIKKIN